MRAFCTKIQRASSSLTHSKLRTRSFFWHKNPSVLCFFVSSVYRQFSTHTKEGSVVLPSPQYTIDNSLEQYEACCHHCHAEEKSVEGDVVFAIVVGGGQEFVEGDINHNTCNNCHNATYECGREEWHK